uniref:Trophoblast glycoprotein 1b n=1 Tax=Gasterosteus aculeatus aculeatus TaxID=481459 RepID=A0AAQ4PFT2_GASAC
MRVLSPSFSISALGPARVSAPNMPDLARRLVLCALLGSVYASCPPRCECSEAALTVKCVSRDLRSVPAGIPGYTRNLFITGNQIGRVGPESFKGLDNVTNLSLSNNRISEVESNTFAGLRALRSLDLSNNQLAVIHPEAFTVHNHSLGSLKGLDLSHNGLIFLPSRIFSHLGSLRRLQLSNNSLVAIHNSSFSGLGRLEELDLTLNALKTVPEEGLRELDSVPGADLLLGENPFTCSCGIEPFALWLNRSQGRIGDADGLACAFPAGMRNTSVLAVGSLTLGCRQWGAGADLALQTSYVFLGIVLGFVGLVFLFVLYLNRKGIKKRINEMREASRELWDGYHYRFEVDSDPRLSQVSSSADV